MFAIAITLLVLELRVPGGTGSLTRRLLHEWPQFAAYLSSFAIIGIMWVNHQYLGAGANDASVAEAVYSANLTLAAVAFSLLWWRGVGGCRLIAAPLGRRAERAAIARFSLGTFVYAATIGIAFLQPGAALAIQAALALYYAFEQVRS